MRQPRPRIRKEFILDGIPVTMRYVKQLCGEKHYNTIIENARERFFANPVQELRYAIPEGILTVWIHVG